MVKEKITFVIATRETKSNFFKNTMAGKTFDNLNILNNNHIKLKLFDNNKLGLSEIYNITINQLKNNPTILIFMHDDVMIVDKNWEDIILSNLNEYDILGVVGSIKSSKLQSSLQWVDINCTQLSDFKNLSGAHGIGNKFPADRIQKFQKPQEVKTLDELFLVVRSETLIDNDLYFDEQFKFDHVDLDFCRRAEELNIKMGTIPLNVIHNSVPDYGSDWVFSCKKYFNKWKIPYIYSKD